MLITVEMFDTSISRLLSKPLQRRCQLVDLQASMPPSSLVPDYTPLLPDAGRLGVRVCPILRTSALIPLQTWESAVANLAWERAIRAPLPESIQISGS